MIAFGRVMEVGADALLLVVKAFSRENERYSNKREMVENAATEMVLIPDRALKRNVQVICAYSTKIQQSFNIERDHRFNVTGVLKTTYLFS